MENITSTSTTTIDEMQPKLLLASSRKPSHEFNHAAAQESPAVIRRAGRQRRTRINGGQNTCKKIKVENSPSGAEEEDDEKAEVEKKIMALQRIVPGGESLGADELFDETADYILALQFQVKALKFLTSFVEGSEKERRKLEG